MIALILAIGLLDPIAAATGDLIAPPDQIVTIPKVQTTVAAGAALPLGAPVWPRPFAPKDRRPYAFDFTEVLPEGARIASIQLLTMSAVGAAAGVEIDPDSDRAPLIDTTGTHVQLWFRVDPAFYLADVFAGVGLLVAVAALIRTDNVPYQEDERTLVLNVRRL